MKTVEGEAHREIEEQGGDDSQVVVLGRIERVDLQWERRAGAGQVRADDCFAG
jgi:hypothetical protein